jgi:ABC-type Fe3+/spermidine/putrescine transport system ATPase subunit
MAPILELSEVSKSFGDFAAVVDLSLSVAEGHFLTLLGASGSGKTTTLRLIAGLETPTSGTIAFAGTDITDLPPTHRDMRMVFQDFALFPNLSVYDNVAFGLRLKRARSRFDRAGIDERVRRYVDLVHLGEHLGKMPHQLSGGQKQRVALARALVTEPRVVLFDEPLGSLDASLRKAMQVELKRLHRELGRTFVYVTHDQDEAMTMSDKVAVMQNARLLQLASPEEIYRTPACTAVARFIGAANVLGGSVEAAAPGAPQIRLRDGSVIRAAPPAAALDRGAAAWVMMRAEHFVIDRRRGTGDENWLSGRIVERLFLGRSVEYQVRLGQSEDVVSVLDQGQDGPLHERGGPLEFGIRPSDVRVLTH